MNKEQVLQHLCKLHQNSGSIFKTNIKVALGLAIMELSGEGMAETPPKVKKVFDKIEAETTELLERSKAARRAARMKGGRI